MKNNSLIILHKHNGENQCWSEIPEGQLNSWMVDGSLEEGDTIIYPQKSMSVVMKKTLELNDVKQKDSEVQHD
jgi:hypothetical protein